MPLRAAALWFVSWASLCACASPADPPAAPTQPQSAAAAASQAPKEPQETAADPGHEPGDPVREPADPAVPSEALGQAGEITLALAELQRAIAEQRLLQHWLGQEAPVEALEQSQLRQRVLIQALEQRVLRKEALRRGLAPTEAQIEEALHNALAGQPPEHTREAGALRLPAAQLEAALTQRFGAHFALLKQVAYDRLIAVALTDAFLNETPDEELQAAWAQTQETLRLDLVQVPRVPTTLEIDQTVRARQAEIAAWYTEHRARYDRPARLRLRMIALPAGPDEAAQEALAAQLHQRALAGADFAQLALEFSVDPSARQGGQLGKRLAENYPALAGLDGGQISAPQRVEDQWRIYQVEGVIPAVRRPLEHPTVQREIAAAWLIERDELPGARGVAQQVAALLSRGEAAQLEQLVQTQRLRRSQTDAFSRADGPVIPGLGLAPEIAEQAFRTREGRVGPIRTLRQHYVVYRVLQHTQAQGADWPAQREAFKAQWQRRQRPLILDHWLNGALKDQPRWVAVQRLEALSLEDLLGPYASLAPPSPPENAPAQSPTEPRLK